MPNNRVRLLVSAASCAIVLSSTPARADVCDLSTARSTCVMSGVYYTNLLPTGTFTVDPFLQLKATTTEQGYNTSGDLNPSTTTQEFQFNQLSGSTHDLQLSSVPLVTIGTVEYREFYLYIDEPGNDPEISLDQLQIFLSPTGNLTNYDTTTRTLNGLTAVYDLDAGGNNWIKLNYRVSKASGGGAMIAYIPNYLFTESGGQYVYVYSQFGAQPTCCTTGGGLEEWWVRSSTGTRTVTRVPEPGILLLLGTAALLAGRKLRRRLA